MLRTLFAVGTAFAVGLMPITAASPEPAAERPLLSQTDTPLLRSDTFSACIAGGGVGDVLLLIDESGSLLRSDVDHARVSSADYFVRNLAGEIDGTSVELNLAVAAFADHQRLTHDWQQLTPDTLSGFLSSIDTFRNLTQGQETDYWMAMDGARSTLAAQAAARGEQRSCQAVVWFSDGEYFLYEGRNPQTMGSEKPYAPGVQLTTTAGTQEAMEMGRHDLCRPGGLADQLRSSRVWIYGVGLDGDPDEPQDFTFMSTVADNRNGECGELTNRAHGEFMLASNIDDLLFAFNGIASTTGLPIETTGLICQDIDCEEMPHHFVLDASVTEVHVLASAEVPSLPMLLETPNGHVIEVEPGGDEPTIVDIPGAQLALRTLSPNTHSLTLEAATDAEATDSWTGQWRLAFVDRSGGSEGKTSRASIRISNPLTPSWSSSSPEGIHVSGGDELSFGLTHGETDVYDAADLLGTFEYVVWLTPAQAEPIELLRTTDPATLAEPYALDLPGDTPLGEATLDLSFTLTTASTETASGETIPGTTLSPAVASYPIPLLPPLNYPVLGNRIDFGAIEGEIVGTASLDVNGSGCVWIDPAAGITMMASPEGVTNVSIAAQGADSESNCLRTDGLDSIALTLTAENQGNGSLVGTVPITIAAEDAVGDPLTVEVPFTASVAKPLNVVNFWLTLIAAIILAIGIPLLLLYLAKLFVSKVPRKPAVAAALIPVEASGGILRRNGAPFGLDISDQTNLLPPSSRRRFTVHGLDFKVRLGLSPFGTGRMELTNQDVFSRSNSSPATTRNGRRASLPVTIHNHFVAIQRSHGPTSSTQLLVFIPAAGPAALEKLSEEIRGKAPGMFEKLAATVEQSSDAGKGDDNRPQHSSGSPFDAGSASAFGSGRGVGSDQSEGLPPQPPASGSHFGSNGGFQPHTPPPTKPPEGPGPRPPASGWSG